MRTAITAIALAVLGGCLDAPPAAKEDVADAEPLPPPPCADPPPWLITCWDLDGSGVDGTGARDLLITGATYTDGIHGQALLRGVDSSVTAQAIAPPPAAFTIDLWVRPDLAQDADLVDQEGSFGIDLDVEGDLFTCYVEGFGVAGTALPAGQWSHVACAYDGGTMFAYRDGVLVETGDAEIVPEFTGPLSLGQDSADGDSGFTGALDVVRIWSRALSADEIAEAATR